jgi:hypothetical protein
MVKQGIVLGHVGCVCEGGPRRPCARGVQAPVFAVLDRERARLPGAKIDAAAWPWRNTNFMRFSAAWLAEARDDSQVLAGGWNHPCGRRRAEAAVVAGVGTHG